MTENRARGNITARIGQLEADVLNAADAIGGFAAMDFDIIRDDLAAGLKSIFLQGEEHALRQAAQELNAIYYELYAMGDNGGE